MIVIIENEMVIKPFFLLVIILNIIQKTLDTLNISAIFALPNFERNVENLSNNR